MMRNFICLFAFIGLLHLATGQQVAITFDDAPFGFSAGMSDADKLTRFDQLLEVLDKYDIKATILITSSNMNEVTKEILTKAKEAGHQLGNHTHRHMNLNTISVAAYIDDIDSCSVLADAWINSNYFRYSYLHRGDTREKRDSVYSHLKRKGLQMAPVSIDNDEWIYNRDYSIALRDGNPTEMNRQVEMYLKHMSEISEAFRKKAIDLLGRELPHILLLHVNPINCDHLDKLLKQYVSQGWTFITLDQAIEDEFYQRKDDYVGPHGFSQIDRIKMHPLN